MKKLYKFIPFFVIIFSVCVFFYPFLLQGKLPVPADTITGLYYPFRDLFSATNPNGLPYKNFLITDPVRQQYPWKNLVTMLEKNAQVPLWNPYEMAGTPLLANFQSSPFYFLNLILFISPFFLSWSIFVLIQPLLAGLFLYLYLRNLKLSKEASLLGAITWAFCGFSIAWMEWGTIIHTALWLPLILLSIDRLVFSMQPARNASQRDAGGYSVLSIKKLLPWGCLYIFAMCSSFLAGHLQVFFYIFIFTNIYFLARLYHSKHKLRLVLLYCILNTLYLILFLPQLLPTLQFISLSSRASDQPWMQPGWFIQYQNLIQFIAPDFFGNPATLNYWGVWNYGEFIGYIGIGSLIFALYAAIFRRDKKIWFFLAVSLAALLFATQNPISALPYVLKIPFISTAQPTRLMFIVDICLAILAGLGLDHFLKSKKGIWIPILILGCCLFGLWLTVLFGKQFFPNVQVLLTSENNLKLPSILFAFIAALLLGYEFLKDKKMRLGIIILLFIFVLFDLFRFGWKFTPFVSQQYLYPDTKVTTVLQNQPGVFRIATTDSRILPPNFSVMYKLQSIEGYDPLYLKNYAMFIAASERFDHSIKEPYGFNRIITPRNLDSQAIDFLNVKYVLSLSDLNNPKFKKIMQVGETRLYENLMVMPRAYFVKNVTNTLNSQDEADMVFDSNLKDTAAVRDLSVVGSYAVGEAIINSYTSSNVVIRTDNTGKGFLVVSDTYYPAIHATIDGLEAKIIPVNLAFRGLVIPAGKHLVVFEPKLF